MRRLMQRRNECVHSVKRGLYSPESDRVHLDMLRCSLGVRLLRFYNYDHEGAWFCFGSPGGGRFEFGGGQIDAVVRRVNR